MFIPVIWCLSSDSPAINNRCDTARGGTEKIKALSNCIHSDHLGKLLESDSAVKCLRHVETLIVIGCRLGTHLLSSHVFAYLWAMKVGSYMIHDPGRQPAKEKELKHTVTSVTLWRMAARNILMQGLPCCSAHPTPWFSQFFATSHTERIVPLTDHNLTCISLVLTTATSNVMLTSVTVSTVITGTKWNK